MGSSRIYRPEVVSSTCVIKYVLFILIVKITPSFNSCHALPSICGMPYHTITFQPSILKLHAGIIIRLLLAQFPSPNTNKLGKRPWLFNGINSLFRIVSSSAPLPCHQRKITAREGSYSLMGRIWSGRLLLIIIIIPLILITD